MNISIAVNTETSLADAGDDLFAISTQSIVLNGNVPQMGSSGKWDILQGNGGILSDDSNPSSVFTGVPGESYILRWRHFNDCSTSPISLEVSSIPNYVVPINLGGVI